MEFFELFDTILLTDLQIIKKRNKKETSTSNFSKGWKVSKYWPDY